ncbi:MAG: N-acetylmuramoyl-L-alanine amidase [Myxococcales bacterium]|nr:N-acetylmuramoyl-L-alanine amidase [Myxococcales bacterium]
MQVTQTWASAVSRGPLQIMQVSMEAPRSGMLPFLSSIVLLAGLDVVVIDPGHGGRQPGAVAPDGTQEKGICLAVSLRLARLLKEKTKARVLLTRRSDRTLSLQQRAEMANRLKAQVFVSIHANSSTRPTARGVETYFLSSRATDRRARLLAARENFELIESKDESQTDDVIQAILTDADKGAMLEASSRLAHLVQHRLIGRVGGEDRSVRQAPFAVLVRAGSAAILVELGFVSHPEERKQLLDPKHQEALAEAMADAIIAYGAGETPKSP